MFKTYKFIFIFSMIAESIFASRILRRNFPVKVPALPQSENAGISLKMRIYIVRLQIRLYHLVSGSFKLDSNIWSRVRRY